MIVGLVAGIVFFNVGAEEFDSWDLHAIASNVQDRIGGLFMIFLGFLTSTTVSVVLTCKSGLRRSGKQN